MSVGTTSYRNLAAMERGRLGLFYVAPAGMVAARKIRCCDLRIYTK